MNEVKELFGNILLKDLMIYGMALYWLYRAAKRLYQGITEIHDKEQEKSSLLEMIKENRDSIDRLTVTIEKHIERDREYKLRSLADKIFVCYNTAKNQGYITSRQAENFEKNLELYDEYGGNGLVNNKYAPEIRNMEEREG